MSIDADHEGSNEPVEKVPTTKKCPNWGYLNGLSIRDRRLNAKYGGLFFGNSSIYLFLQAQRKA